MEYYLVEKINEMLTHATTYKNYENMLSEKASDEKLCIVAIP